MRAKLEARARGAAKHLAAMVGFDLRRIHNPAQSHPVGDLRSFLRHLRDHPFDPKLMFDVGAFRGDVTTLLYNTFDRPVVMVEPLEEMAGSLRHLSRQPSITWERSAAGPVCTTSLIYIDKMLDGTSMVPHGGMPRKVIVTTLDALAERHGVPGLVKIDVQGFELEVLAGAKRLLGRTEVFILEVLFVPHQGLTQFDEVIRFMADRGYVVYDFAGFARRPLDGALGQADVCFVRESGPLRPAGWARAD